MTDNQFIQPTEGQADWDTSLRSNFSILERGYHVTGQAGIAVKTGDVLWSNSGQFFFPFNPNSRDIQPHAIAFTSAASGDSLMALAWGIVRSLGIHSPAVPGIPCFVSPVTPGVVVGSYSGADRPIGYGIGVPGIMFAPGRQLLPEKLSRTTSFTAVTGSLHYFTVDGGQWGWIREVRVIGNSTDLLNLKFHSGSARVNSERLFETKSGGVYTIAPSHYLDRAGWPYENTEVSTISGLIYGTLKIDSAAAVGSDGLSVRVIFDRGR